MKMFRSQIAYYRECCEWCIDFRNQLVVPPILSQEHAGNIFSPIYPLKLAI